jgi:SET domain-containing protein
MDLNWLSPLCQANPSGEKGWGSFAQTPIPAGTPVAAFGGHAVPGEVFRSVPEERQGRSIQIDDDLFMLSAEQPEPGDMVNHSCEPNCGLRGGVVVVAMRDIAVGEEITFDYAMCDGTDYDEFECACGAPTCRGLVTGNDWRDPVLQAKYAGWFSPYLAARISAVEA